MLNKKTSIQKIKNKKSKNNFSNKKNSFLNSYLLNEILSIIFIAISILLIISIFTNNSGTIGNFLNNILKIFFGIGIYILPFIIISINIYNLISKKRKILSYEFLIYFSIFILVLTLLHILTFSPIKEKFISLLIFLELCKNRSGILVEVLSTILLQLFGKVGSLIILITNIVILIIILTKRSLVELITFLKNKFKIYNKQKKYIIINNINDKKSIKLKNNNIQETKDEIYIKSNNDIVIDEENNKNKIHNSSNKNNLSETNFNKTVKKNINYGYKFPPIELLKTNRKTKVKNSKSEILENSIKLEKTLKSFGVNAKVIEVSKGPTVTRYELSPGQGVKVSKISNLTDDLALNLAAKRIRIEAPIPGKSVVGIEVSNNEKESVYLRDVIEDKQFKNFPSNLAFALGKDVSGQVIITDLSKMPHLLIAGATGSGKSVCINTLITSLIYKSSPNEVKLIMIDPKVVELNIYNGIPHLMIPVVTDPKNASGALNWAVKEMLRRYELFANSNVRDLDGYNIYISKENKSLVLPKIVIIIDELSDLMMAAPNEVEDSICRLAQMARAAGLHLIIATQRPSVDVITGIIKANIPSRLAFSVSSGIDSRTILDMTGAEKLLGHGDMLFYPVGMTKPIRIQGAFISDKEVESIVTFLKKDYTKKYDEETIKNIISTRSTKNTTIYKEENDELFKSVVNFIIEKDKASASLLQRQFRIGFNKAARLIEILEDKRFVSQENGSKPRKVLITKEQWYKINKKENK